MFDKKFEAWQVLGQASLTKEQKAELPGAYYSDNGLKPELLAPMAGYPTGDLMLDSLVELQRKIQANGGLDKLIDDLIEAEVVKRLRWKRPSKACD